MQSIHAAEAKTRMLPVFGGAIRIKHYDLREPTHGGYAAYEITCEPGAGPPLHVHNDVDEAFYVLQGTFEFQLGEQRMTQSAGWFGFGPRDVPHAFAARGDTPATLLMIVSPAGLEVFFARLSEMTAERPADMEAVTALFEAHGMKIVGPPLAAEPPPAPAAATVTTTITATT